MGTAQGLVQVPNGSIVPCRNVHTVPWQEQVPGPIICSCSSPVPCAGPNPVPMQCEYINRWKLILSMFYYICDGLGYPPLSRLVAQQWSSSRTGLGYWRRASTHLLKRIANGGPQGSHLNPPSNGASAPARAPHMRAIPKFSIKAGHTAAQGSFLVSHWSSHN